ncbi:MAG: methyltransferase [Eubacteriales bacterium]|nr:methyltransferase [Eubacteriales bacterium]NLO12653.1 methyltransferase [Clostridiales bacterium]
MAEHYFTPNPDAEHNPREIALAFGSQRFRFLTDTAVFSKNGLDEGSAMLLDAVMGQISGTVLDLGCGWGPVGVITARLYPSCQVTMLDINARACHLAEENARRNGIKAKVLCQDGLIGMEQVYDWILLNPPIRAGKETVYRLFRESAERLNPSGILAVVIRKQQGASSAKRYLEGLFCRVTLQYRKKGYHVYFCAGGTKIDI